jgi:hypothetical protein
MAYIGRMRRMKFDREGVGRETILLCPAICDLERRNCTVKGEVTRESTGRLKESLLTIPVIGLYYWRQTHIFTIYLADYCA